VDSLGGFAGRMLEVDLTAGTVSVKPLPREMARRFIGGAGLNARLAYDAIPVGISPFAAENVLFFGAGPLVGTLAPGAGKTNFSSKSPLTGYFGTSGSGHLGFVKYAGYDHLLITGKASSPVYLEVGDEVRLRDAQHLWGKDTWETTDLVWSELGRQWAVASIGQAGENLNRDANIVANKYSAFGKTGMGAVMGSKNLKAIAAYGSRGIGVAEPKRFMKLVNDMAAEVLNAPGIAEFRHRGTLSTLSDMIAAKAYGSVPWQNCQQMADEELMYGFDLEHLDAETVRHGNLSCLGCPVGCKHFMLLRDGQSMSMSCAAAPVVCFGGNTAVSGWGPMYRCAELCNRLGIDYGSASCLVSMAIEMYQRGIITSSDTGGMELDWRADVVHELITKIALREGFGDVLGDGLLEAPRRIGRGADYYAMHYKGIGNSVGDPRPGVTSWLSSLITNVIGHAPGVLELEGKPLEKVERVLRRMGAPEEQIRGIVDSAAQLDYGPLTRWTEDHVFAVECLGVCTFPFNQAFGVNRWAEVYSAATGIDMDDQGMLDAAARGIDMKKAFSVREGFSRNDDGMPARFLSEPLRVHGEDRPPYEAEALDRLVSNYYRARGWDMERGDVKPDRVAELVRDGASQAG